MRQKLDIDFGHWLVDTYQAQRNGRVRVSHIKAACNALNVADACRAVFAPYPARTEGGRPRPRGCRDRAAPREVPSGRI